MIVLDFETRSRCNLLEAGSSNYALDPSTDILCLTLHDLDDGAEWAGITLHGQQVLPDEWHERLKNGER